MNSTFKLNMAEKEINDLKKRLGNIRLKIMNTEIELRSLNEEKDDIKKMLLEVCEHKHVICYRYYYSGMHRAEHSYECKACRQNLSFDQYCKSETHEDRDG